QATRNLLSRRGEKWVCFRHHCVAIGAWSSAYTSSQYGGFFRSRCALAASIHHARSSAKRGNACDSALPPSPVGLPSSVSVCAIGPAAIVLEITTMPISESVPCHASAARAPEKRPAE